MAAEAELGQGRGVLCVPEARWLRWDGGVLQVSDREGPGGALTVRAEQLTLVGRVFGALGNRPGDGRRLSVAARFAQGATVLIERRGARIAVAASPRVRPKAAG